MWAYYCIYLKFMTASDLDLSRLYMFMFSYVGYSTYADYVWPTNIWIGKPTGSKWTLLSCEFQEQRIN